MKTLSVILLAGGKGTRMRSAIPKQFIHLKEKALIHYSFDLLKTLPSLKEIIVVCEPKYQSFFKNEEDLPLLFAPPGLRRQDSVYNGLKQVSKASHLVCIHDGARPFLDKSMILKLIDEAALYGAATLAVPLKFTLKAADDKGFVAKTLDRSCLFEIQTPQVIKLQSLTRGFDLACEKNLEVTDDVSLIEALNEPVKLVMGSYQNIKITTEEDLKIAEKILDQQK